MPAINCTQQAILDRQRCNGDCSRPLAFELDPILRKIGSRLAQVAKGLYLRAESRIISDVNTLYDYASGVGAHLAEWVPLSAAVENGSFRCVAYFMAGAQIPGSASLRTGRK